MTSDPGARRIGLLGGTFDPPHVGHLVAAREVREALDLDELRLVVAAGPPHKSRTVPAPPELRARMLDACLEEADGARLRVSRVELERPPPSWTVDTLRLLRDREPGVEWFLVLGADQLAEFGEWREPEEIARLARLVGVGRAGMDPAEVEPGLDVAWETVEVTRIDVSSTAIRARIRSGRSVRWLVPGPALRIIEEAKLYAPGAAGGDHERNGTTTC